MTEEEQRQEIEKLGSENHILGQGLAEIREEQKHIEQELLNKIKDLQVKNNLLVDELAASQASLRNLTILRNCNVDMQNKLAGLSVIARAIEATVDTNWRLCRDLITFLAKELKDETSEEDE